MRFPAPVLLALALAACGQSTAPTPPPATVAAAPPIWFICDGIDAPVLFLFSDSPDDRHVHVVRYDKTTGASLGAEDIDIGDAEGAAGSVYTTLMRDGASIGAVRQANPGVLETPGSAYTTPITSIAYDNVNVSCRWMPRTRLFAFTGRRSIVIHEDPDGDLIYSTYDFATSGRAQQVEQSENGRTTTFSVEVRGGEEAVSPSGAEFRFAGPDNFTYIITANADGHGALDVERGGEAVQSEPLIAFQMGSAAP